MATRATTPHTRQSEHIGNRAIGYGLTKRQADLLAFLRQHQAAHGYGPSFDEMMVALGLASKSGIFRLLGGLENRGLIRRQPNRARSVLLIEEVE